MRWAGDMTGAEMIAQFQSAYAPSLIYRNTNWMFYAGKPVYLLRDPEGATWVLQEFTKDIGWRSQPPAWREVQELPGADVRDHVPTRTLLDTSRAGGWAAILRDELGCAYQGRYGLM
jgi:hypothetical protein